MQAPIGGRRVSYRIGWSEQAVIEAPPGTVDEVMDALPLSTKGLRDDTNNRQIGPGCSIASIAALCSNNIERMFRNTPNGVSKLGLDVEATGPRDRVLRCKECR